MGSIEHEILRAVKCGRLTIEQGVWVFGRLQSGALSGAEAAELLLHGSFMRVTGTGDRGPGRPKELPRYLRRDDVSRRVGAEFQGLIDRYRDDPRSLSATKRAMVEMLRRHPHRQEKNLLSCLRIWREYVAFFCWEHNLTPDDPIFPAEWLSAYEAAKRLFRGETKKAETRATRGFPGPR